MLLQNSPEKCDLSRTQTRRNEFWEALLPGVAKGTEKSQCSGGSASHHVLLLRVADELADLAFWSLTDDEGRESPRPAKLLDFFMSLYAHPKLREVILGGERGLRGRLIDVGRQEAAADDAMFRSSIPARDQLDRGVLYCIESLLLEIEWPDLLAFLKRGAFVIWREAFRRFAPSQVFIDNEDPSDCDSKYSQKQSMAQATEPTPAQAVMHAEERPALEREFERRKDAMRADLSKQGYGPDSIARIVEAVLAFDRGEATLKALIPPLCRALWNVECTTGDKWYQKTRRLIRRCRKFLRDPRVQAQNSREV